MSTSKSLHLASDFTISCGTVAVDLQRSKILLVKWLKNGEIFLAKGRKDVGERLEDTAIRETY